MVQIDIRRVQEVNLSSLKNTNIPIRLLDDCVVVLEKIQECHKHRYRNHQHDEFGNVLQRNYLIVSYAYVICICHGMSFTASCNKVTNIAGGL